VNHCHRDRSLTVAARFFSSVAGYAETRASPDAQAPAAMRFLSIEPLLEDLGQFDLTGIDWVIVGGESGHGARPMEEDWVHAIRKQCEAAAVPFFFKQWGGVQKSKRGRLLGGKTFDEMPNRRTIEVASRHRRMEMIREVSAWEPAIEFASIG